MDLKQNMKTESRTEQEPLQMCDRFSPSCPAPLSPVVILRIYIGYLSEP